ncbi:malonyl-ACP O-methyltransferase BioC [Paenibacillus silvae]|uniref:malonyl-ACP O-methyltransferase BioC n=1 Tax=Paenibacillus TaxID=44249 RepID=UPI0025A2255D|nr:malonyl-ACP O-methyltransferase BioC [Paenibacillus silvae]MDM5279905.1 malonyl-ACP O-methyltransferase BioC [Paenibacillus silvae]
MSISRSWDENGANFDSSINVQRRFNRNASSYDTHAHVQRRMASRLAGTLAHGKNNTFSHSPTILEIGCGTGFLTHRIANDWPEASITAVDIAPEMIRLASRRCLSVQHAEGGKGTAEGIHFVLADIEKWVHDAPSCSVDIIVSNACFQWLRDPQQTLNGLKRILRPRGRLLFTTFGTDTFREMHEAFHEVYLACRVQPQRHGLSFHSAEEWRVMLERSGFTSYPENRLVHIERYASARNFLHSVRGMGASTSEAAQVPGVSLRTLFTRMYKVYEDRFSVGAGGGVQATYDLLFIEAVVSDISTI